MLAREIVSKINSEDVKEALKMLPDDKKTYLLNYIYEMIVDENKEEYVMDDEEIKKHK